VTGLLDPVVRAAPLLSPAEERVNRFWGTPAGACIRAVHVRSPREAAGMAHPLERVAMPSDALWSRRWYPLWALDPLAQAPDAWHSPRGQAAQDTTPWAIRGRMGYHTAGVPCRTGTVLSTALHRGRPLPLDAADSCNPVRPAGRVIWLHGASAGEVTRA